ncbi:hypothetical protein PSTG_04598 [Puccinia striiformis f. sp. tritici PST-78]|uniref:Uncharacterized protein n=1 Tax=Puccinia striiformis f. sp. tritici PST-78 TaxID=1165861 RepID=A0A0L0VSX3_9BASI|nr:hypothetical protein PSTG_04598 [Puccinia striiformis f. sp. tritici PST-78]
MQLSSSLFVSIVWSSQLVCSRSITQTASGDVIIHTFAKRGLTLQDYPNFQISNGVAGRCAQKAASVFLKPYELNQEKLIQTNPLKVQITKADLDTCKTMNRAAVDAEDKFVFAINNVGSKSSVGRELENGKICNKVLKLTAAVLCLQMELKLKPSSDSSRTIKLDDEIKKLQKNIQLDQAAKGQRQHSFLSN